MNFSAKINLLLLPLFVSILLSTASKLKVGPSVDTVFYSLLSPISLPVSWARLFTEEKYSYFKNIPDLKKQNRDQKNQIASLISENESLKQILADNKVTANLNFTFRKFVPVRLAGSTGNFVVTSTRPTDDIRPGQPLISGSILLGTVKEVRSSVILVIPLDNEKTPSFFIRTSSGQKGLYKYEDSTPQIIDIPSQSPLVLGDTVLTEPSEIFPGNLIIGKTSRLLTISQEPLQKAEITLYDSLDKNPDNLAIITQP